MAPFTHTSLCKTQRFGRVALTALVIGFTGAALTAVPLDNLAFAGNGNGNGGGKGGGNGGGHGHDGGKGGGNSGGNGGGQDSHGASGQSHAGKGGSAKSGKGGANESDGDPSGDDDSAAHDGALSPSQLGKLNGFFHASENGLANASPNSAHGRISQTFRDALSEYAKANEAGTDPENPDAPGDPNATPPEGPSIDDLGAILAGATNKTVTPTQVKAIIERLADLNPDDESLNDLADTVDGDTAQDIAAAANKAKSGDTSASDADTAGNAAATSNDAGTDADGETTGGPTITALRTTN